LSKIPATLSVITQDALEKRNHKDVESMVKDVPSLFGATLGAANRRGISIRGLSQRYTKILVNGIPVPGDNAYKGLRSVGGSYSFIPPASAISRIEVIRGPMSSLYGSDALGGVILLQMSLATTFMQILAQAINLQEIKT